MDGGRFESVHLNRRLVKGRRGFVLGFIFGDKWKTVYEGVEKASPSKK